MQCPFQSPRSSRNDLPEAVAPTLEFQKEVSPFYFGPRKRSRSFVAGQRWTRRPVLLVCGITVALIAGVIGGFIGKAISEGRPNHHYLDTAFSSRTLNNSLVRNLPIPSTGCFPDSQRKYLKPGGSNHSTFLEIHYQIMCATRWTDDHLAAISAATPSDCIEACSSYNDSAKQCLGASFVPLWWNQTRAMEDKKEPFNCFLMSENKTIFTNDLGFEVVALCLGDDKTHSCPRIIP